METSELKFSREDLIRKPKAKSLYSKLGITLFLMTLPTIVYIFIFHYMPLEGLLISFKDYNSFQGIFGSPWTSMGGFKHFYTFVTSPNFLSILRNTLVLSLLSIVFNSILPIIYALFLNEVRNKGYKKLIQLIMYAPYFISVVVLVGMLFVFFDVDSGIFTKILVAFGFDQQNMMENPDAFAAIYVISGIWQGLGWWSIVYIGTLSNVDPNLHDAARIDGAGRFRRIFYINLPAIIPLAIIMFIMSIGNVLNVGFEKVYLMQLSTNLSKSEIISTYVYRISFPDYGLPQYSYATAIGLFNSAINIVILCIANFISKKVSHNSLW
ncbi:MAG: ABC transporter permease subunit [Candidatus Onthovivens sp.]|nr:ABC transporter permease subunit [Mollicutes bacterium]MDY4857196.1 ABC transporter permease subunit [Candidatus Onthovivens sp.]MDY4936607.1 ABC transporter permease subunit [Candidatus Onthovivens sp.]